MQRTTSRRDNTQRWSHSRLNYKLELPPGKSAVVLCFAETNPNYMGQGKRTFDILLGSEKVHEAIDVFSQVGANEPLHLTIHTEVTTAPLVVELRRGNAGPAIKGIVVEALSSQ